MDTTVRATCPKCRNILRIPAQWVGQAVKCKKCGSIVRSKPKGDANTGTAEAAALDPTGQNDQPVPAANAFDFSKPSPEDENFLGLEPAAPEAGNPFDPAGADASAQPPAMPGYPYPLPPGYAPPPGYPYAPPPGYPYPVPPAGYAPPPGYPYPAPPGYPPGAYAPPPGYPYAPLPADPNAPAMPYPAPYPAANAPVPVPVPGVPVPVATAAPARPVKPGAPNGTPLPARNPPRPAPDPVPPSNEFQTDAPAAPGGRRYKRGGGGQGKMIWVAVCLLLTAGLVAGGILGVKYLNDKGGKDKKEPEGTKLVQQLGSTDASERDAAFKKLKELGARAEEALREGKKFDNPDIAKRCDELLAALGGGGGPGAGGNGGGPGNGGTPVARSGAFPRRMLFIHISRYMFLNPLTYAEVRNGITGEDKTKPAALRLAHEWQVPLDSKNPEGNQLFLLSDTARPDAKGDLQLPMKNVVTGAYDLFFNTSRAQDRIVLYFGGHVLEKDGKVYLAPIEADPDDFENTMIPLADFYAKLGACKATQKVVIWDVCRFNPDRGRQRPGSEPMTESLHTALATPPEGVEAVVTCQPGENALEFFNQQVETGATATALRYAGSSFLESMKYVASKSARNASKQPTAADPIPVADWAAAVAKQTAYVANLTNGNPKQTVKLEGKPRATQVAYNPEEAPAKRFEMPVAPKGTSPEQIASIVSEFNVPPIRPDLTDTGLSDLAFRDEVMKDFKADVPIEEIMKDKEKYRFRAATVAAFDKVRKMWAKAPGADGGNRTESFPDPVNDALKKKIKNEQEFWAVGIAELELINSELDLVAPMREGEPKRWQAHYEYARAVVKTRLAYMNEYNKLMGDVLTETLPALDKKLQDGYKLVSSEKMKSKKDVQKLADEAKESYEKLVTEYKGTPWSIQAKREKNFTLGLAWQPASLAPGMNKE